MDGINSDGLIEQEEDLINQIELEMRNIYLSVETLYNNIYPLQSDDPIEKSIISNRGYSCSLLERELSDYSEDRNEDPLKLLVDSLQKELKFLEIESQRVAGKMIEYREMIKRLDNNTANLHAMLETARTEKNTSLKLDNITNNIKKRFLKEKAELKDIIHLLFSENDDIQDLIARIIEHYFTEGSDKYLLLEEEDNIMEQIELLRRTNLFEVNPHNLMEIRVADLI